MPKAAKSKLFIISEYFRTAELESAKELLAYCRQIMKEREPKPLVKPRKPRTPRPSVPVADKPPMPISRPTTTVGEHLGGQEGGNQ